MARYTSAYSSFVARLNEVEILRQSALTKEKKDPINRRSEIDALCRGAIVLLCAHLEAYIKELGEVALTNMHVKSVPRATIAAQFYYHISKDMLDEVINTTHPDRIANKVFNFLQTDLPYWDRNGPFPLPLPADRFNKGFSNPAFEKIRAYLNRFGYSDYRRDLASKLQANYHPTVTMVNHLVDTRNKIAHGDPAASKTPRDVGDMIAIIKVYCISTDTVFAGWCRNNLCPIR